MQRTIQVPYETKEHNEIAKHAKKQGFNTLAAYVRWLIAQDMKK